MSKINSVFHLASDVCLCVLRYRTVSELQPQSPFRWPQRLGLRNSLRRCKQCRAPGNDCHGVYFEFGFDAQATLYCRSNKRCQSRTTNKNHPANRSFRQMIRIQQPLADLNGLPNEWLDEGLVFRSSQLEARFKVLQSPPQIR